ncbi:unnamed protein product [Lymnaea stagnalis]|uniref:Sugar transporter SWEET n=1 Tax=Lymnaea stagnalis TaxID=6523 RepID=A0AAV2GYS8_LYMST
MEIPALITIVEWSTIAVTFIMMGSGIPLCVNMLKKKTTDNVPYLMFLILSFVSLLSLQYALLIKNNTLTFINVTASLVWGFYVCVYNFVSKNKSKPLLQLLVLAGLYSSHYYYLTIVPPADVVPTLGSYLLFWVTVLSLLPALDFITIFKEKSTRCCDLPMLLGGTLNGGVWYLYGILMNDINIYFPAIPGLLVSALKFGLMIVYGPPSKTVSTKASASQQATTYKKKKTDLQNNNFNERSSPSKLRKTK